ncbi:hypothetical protein VCHA28FP16_390001 [Vibrio chagasii]|nr:hypothetical protein VCHA28FP16_390001 [Vibrio chagasii]
MSILSGEDHCQRGAFLVQVGYSVYGGLVECGGRVVSHLAGRCAY